MHSHVQVVTGENLQVRINSLSYILLSFYFIFFLFFCADKVDQDNPITKRSISKDFRKKLPPTSVLQRAEAFKSKNPFFMVKLQPTHITRSQMVSHLKLLSLPLQNSLDYSSLLDYRCMGNQVASRSNL